LEGEFDIFKGNTHLMLEYPFKDGALLNGSASIALVSLLFLVHHFIVSSEWFCRRTIRKTRPTALSIRRVLYRRLLGILLFGLIPISVVTLVFHEAPGDYGLSTEEFRKSFLLWLPVASGIVALSYFMARSPKNLAVYPQIRIEQ
jgi:hypothetical protein